MQVGSCLASLLDVLRSGPLTEEQARMIYAQGPEAVVFALLELSKRLAEQQAEAAAQSHQTPSTPSGMKPPYQKAARQTPQTAAWSQAGPSRFAAKTSRTHRPPQGASGQPLSRIAAVVCNAATKPAPAIPKTFRDIQPEVTEHTIHRDWCPTVPEAGRAGGSRRPARLDAWATACWCCRPGCTTAWATRSRRSSRSSTSTCR